MLSENVTDPLSTREPGVPAILTVPSPRGKRNVCLEQFVTDVHKQNTGRAVQ